MSGLTQPRDYVLTRHPGALCVDLRRAGWESGRTGLPPTSFGQRLRISDLGSESWFSVGRTLSPGRQPQPCAWCKMEDKVKCKDPGLKHGACAVLPSESCSLRAPASL